MGRPIRTVFSAPLTPVTLPNLGPVTFCGRTPSGGPDANHAQCETSALAGDGNRRRRYVTAFATIGRRWTTSCVADHRPFPRPFLADRERATTACLVSSQPQPSFSSLASQVDRNKQVRSFRFSRVTHPAAPPLFQGVDFPTFFTIDTFPLPCFSPTFSPARVTLNTDATASPSAVSGPSLKKRPHRQRLRPSRLSPSVRSFSMA